MVRQILKKENIDCFNEVIGAEIERSKIKKIQQTMSRYRDLPAFYVGDTKGDMIEGEASGCRHHRRDMGLAHH